MDRAFGIDTVGEAVQPQENILQQVCRRFRFAGYGKRGSIDQGAMPIIKIAESFQVTVLQTKDQVPVFLFYIRFHLCPTYLIIYQHVKHLVQSN